MNMIGKISLPYAVAIAALCLAGALAAFLDDSTSAQSAVPCPAPTPTAVAVTVVPIVVTSTTDDYFVLYVSHDVDGTEVELPVLVKRGEAGTTTLAENMEALPAERYRVEKYLIADPADVDGDCIDDITELDDLGNMNPVNPAAAIELSDGAVAISDQETFETLTRLFGSQSYLKFIVDGIATARPDLYFINAETHPAHGSFLTDVLGLDSGDPDVIRGEIGYVPEAVAPDGSLGFYYYTSAWRAYSFSLMERTHTLLAASMPLLENDLAYWIASLRLRSYQSDLPLYRASRIPVVFDADVYPDTGFLPLNPGEGYGVLRVMEPDDRPHPRDVVIYEALPNELPRMAGIISTVPQTPLSHVNLRAIQDDIPNAFIRDALDDADVDALIGSYVRYEVLETGWSLRTATPEEVDEHYESSRPTQAQTPERDLSVTSITPLSDVGFDDWDAFGVKAANLAVLRTLALPEGTVRDGFAVPFYFYDEFMKANDLYTRITTMLADEDFQTDFDVQDEMLDDLRDDIKDADSPQWIIDALTEMHATFPEGTSLRYRSSTNNEDLPGFNGAGLYDSKTQDPEETEEDGIDKSLKGVFASLWNFRAFTEREFHRVDHTAAAMGVLVHPNFSDELANGVAVSFALISETGGLDPVTDTEGWYYVNTQVGEDLVTNPEAHSVPEEILLGSYGVNRVLSLSNLVEPGELLMSFGQLRQLREHLEVIHSHFEGLYGPAADEPFAMEIEFKITSGNVLAIKQARPWVFGAESVATTRPPSESTPTPTPTPTATPGPTGACVTGLGTPSGTIARSGTWSSDCASANRSGRYARFYSFSLDQQSDSLDQQSDVQIDLVSSTDTFLFLLRGSGTEGSVMRRNDDGGDGLNSRISRSLPAGTYTIEATTYATGATGAFTLTLQANGGGTQPTNSPATGAPTVTGTAQVGETLSADTSAIADADGLANVSFSYQWIRNDGSSDTDITGATDSTHSLDDADEGKAIKVKVSFTDDADNGETLTSAATGSVAARPDQGSAPDAPDRPVGTAVFAGGVDLEWNDVPGADSYDVQLFRNGQWMDLPGDGVEIASYGAGAIISELDPGSSYWFQVRARNAHSSSDWSDYRQVGSTNQSSLGKRARPDNVTASGAPVINGTAQVGESLTADTTGIEDGNGLDRVQFRFQWVSNDGSADADITGATDSTYTLVAADEGKTVKVRVSFTDRGGYAESLTSAATDTVSFAVQQQVANSPATGAPAISGTAQVGQTLTADTSGITDSDGLTNVSYSYQWVANDGTNDTDISGATGSTYTLVDADEGNTVKVKVSFTDDAGHGETLTSAATAAVDAASNSPATGAPSISGTAQVGETLTADTSGIADADGLSNVSYSYQWIRNDGSSDSDITSATGSSYTLAAADEGGTIKVRVSFTDDADNGETLTSAATAAVDAAPNSPATGAPTITGTAQVGQTLTADISAIADADGLDTASYSYQWIANDGTSDTDIAGATDSTYTLAAGDQGRTIKVRVSFTDDAGYGETLTSAATAAVDAAPNSPATGAPAISGAAQVGQTLTADTSGIADADGLDNVSYSYQWIRNDGGTDTDISGATDPGYTLAADDEGRTIKVKVSFTDDADNGETLTSPATAAVDAAPNSPATGAPTITGTAQVGQTLTADTSAIADADGLTNVSYSYQWIANDGTSDSDISGGTDSTYTLAATDEGRTIRVRVSFTDDAGNGETLTSPATAAVDAAPNNPATGAPSITGTAQVGETLSADTSAIADADGLTNVSYSYQWVANDGSSDSDITSATDSTYSLDDADEGKTIKVKVGFTDDAGSDESLASAATASVAARPNQGSAPDTPDRPVGTAVFAGGVDLEWNDVPGADSYDVQLFRNGQWMDLPGDGVEIAFYGAGAIISELDPGSSYWFQVRARNAHGSSDWSNYRQVGSTNQDPLGKRARPDNVTASGAPVINGTAQVGESLTADAAGIEDGNGLDRVQFRFQWVSNDGSADADITGATDSTYTLVAADEGKTVKVRVSLTDRGGYAESLTSDATDTVSFAVQQQVANSPATGAPAISGTAQVGQTLTADTSGIADDDGLTNVSYSYQWVANDGTNDTDISGATGSTYTLVDADEGNTVKVRVSFTDDADNEETLTSAATAAVDAAPNSPAAGAPSISGAAQVGETLTADTSGIADADGLSNVSYSYQWIRNDGSSDSDITSATGSSYTLAAADEGRTIKVKVSFTDDADNGETLTSAATAAVDAEPNSPATGTPTITGTAQVGQTLTADTSAIADADGLTNVSYSYQWIRNDGSSDTDIQDATDSTYSLVDADEGKTIKVRVSFTDDAGHGETLTSAATGIVAAALLPLTVSLENNPATHNGTDVFTFEIRFSEEFPLSFRTLKFHALQVTGGTVKKALRVDNSSDIHWRITVRPDADGNVTIVLPVTDDCDDQGAICTGDGRKLSNSLEFTVAGPGG